MGNENRLNNRPSKSGEAPNKPIKKDVESPSEKIYVQKGHSPLDRYNPKQDRDAHYDLDGMSQADGAVVATGQTKKSQPDQKNGSKD